MIQKPYQISPFANQLRRLNLKTKILVFVASILFLAIMIVGISAYFLAVNQVVDKVIETQLGLVKQVSSNIDFILNDADTTSSLIIFEPSLQKDLQQSLSGGEVFSYSNWAKFLERILATKSYISMIALYGYNGLAYSTASGYTSNKVGSFSDLQKNPLYQKALDLDGGIVIEYFRNNPPLVSDNRTCRILMYRMIKDTNKYHNLGVLLIWLDEAKIRSIYQSNVPVAGNILIADPKGMIVSDSDPAKIGESATGEAYWKMLKSDTGSGIIKVNRRKMLFTSSTSSATGWKVATLTPAAVLTEKINALAFVIISVGIVCYVLLFYLSTYITSIITNPLKQLLDSIKQVQKGDFSQQVSFSGQDEIGELGQGYNAMIAHIRDLIERVYKLQIQEREAELNALQAQINPHFLYNTLDTIFWKAEKNQVPEISEMVYALSKIFRLSLNRGNELATVAQEQELISYYLILQQIRFKNRLTYRIDFEERLLELPIPKLIIQPFVENAIIHGLEELETDGNIKISGRLEEEQMVFTVTDNGVGMTEEKIQQIVTKNNPRRNTPTMVSGGYAIRNVIERLELYYSSHYQLVFDSKPGTGTTVTVRIPVIIAQKADFGASNLNSAR
jgi:two-component system, sensor histidine kinase YesM